MRDTILNEMRSVAALHERRLPELTDNLPLKDSGLDSLCFALLVARLEDMLGRDPLSEASSGRFPSTIGEFVALYEEALA
jgi:acyl carrier protein